MDTVETDIKPDIDPFRQWLRLRQMSRFCYYGGIW